MQQGGDKERLSNLINEYQNLIFTICYRFTSDYFASEDLTQDTFLSAYAHMSEIEVGKEKYYLARVANNKCIDYLRKRKHETIQSDEDFSAIPADLPDIHEKLEEEDVREELKQKCRKLKDPYGEVAYRYYYLEQTPEIIAADLKKKTATIKTQLYRARDMLRKLYGKEGTYDGQRVRAVN